LHTEFALKLKILQWNIRGFYSRKPFLHRLTDTLSPDILCLQETHLKPHKKSYIKGYHLASRCDRVDRDGGGTMIFVKSETPCIELNITKKLEVVAIKSFIEKAELTICSLYLPPNHENTNLIEDLNKILEELPTPFIIHTDANAHHPSWGSEQADHRGNLIEQWIADNGLILLNTEEPTFLSSAGTYSHIDITIATPDIADLLNWSPYHNTNTSDHFPIIIDSEIQIPEVNSIDRWSTLHENWGEFQKKLTLPTDFISPTNACSTVTESIHTAAYNTIPLHKGKRNSKGTKCWWTRECNKEHRNKNRALSHYKNHKGNIEAWISFKKAQAKFKNTVINAKRDSWYRYLNNLSADTSSGEMWKLIKRMNGTYVRRPIILEHNNEMITSQTEVADMLAQHFSEKSSGENSNVAFREHKITQEQTEVFFEDADAQYNNPITLTELKTALARSKSKSPGPDNIPYAFLQNLTHNQLLTLLTFYNYIFNTGFPEQWRESIIIPLLKPGKTATLATSYRPIALTNVLCKTLEKIINWRLQAFLEETCFYDPCQSGFRAGHCTMDPLCRITESIQNCLLNGKYCLAIFLDIKGAFDCVWHHGLYVKLQKAGINGKTARFIKEFTQKRKIRVRTGNHTSNPYQLHSGVPQGSVLSPTLFSIMINDIFEGFPSTISHSLYADDGAIWTESNTLAEAAITMQDAISKLEKWTQKCGLQLSADKTKAIIFSNRRLTFPDIKLNDQSLEYVTNISFLGVILDSKLTWLPHIKQIQIRCRKDLSLMSIIAAKHWGAQQSTLTKFYNSIIIPKLDYASFLYSDAAPTHLLRLDRIQYAASRIILGALRCTPVSRLEAEADLMPLRHRRMELLSKYACRILTIPRHPIQEQITKHREIYNLLPNKDQLRLPFSSKISRELKDINISPNEIKQIPLRNRHTILDLNVHASLAKYSKDSFSEENWQVLFKELMSTHDDRISVYTDGSMQEHLSGCGIWSSSFQIVARLPNYTPVQTCELYAIYSALKFLTSMPGKYIILTDSLSSVQAIKSTHNSKNYIVHWIADTLMQTPKDKIIIEWVPGHTGIQGNEEADSLAKTSLKLSHTTNILPTSSQIKHAIKKHYYKKWESEWAAMPTGITAFKTELGSGSAPGVIRSLQVTVSRIHLGVTKISHGHYAKKCEPERCDYCDCRLTHQHLFIECPQYQQARKILTTCCRELNKQFTLKTVMNSSFPAEKLLSFLQSTKMTDKI